MLNARQNVIARVLTIKTDIPFEYLLLHVYCLLTFTQVNQYIQKFNSVMILVCQIPYNHYEHRLSIFMQPYS